jgi:hypothetical protein
VAPPTEVVYDGNGLGHRKNNQILLVGHAMPKMSIDTPNKLKLITLRRFAGLG